MNTPDSTHPAWPARHLLELMITGKAIAAAATIKYANSSVRYLAIGPAPDPLGGIQDWATTGGRVDDKPA